MTDKNKLEESCTHNCNTCQNNCGGENKEDKVTDVFESIADFCENIESKDLLDALNDIINS